MPKKLFIITSSFPYLPGEQFIEDEVIHWANSEFSSVTIFPCSADGSPRPIPNNVDVDLSLSKDKKLQKILWLFPAFFSTIFLKEVIWLTKKRKININNLYQALKECSTTKRRKKKLESIIKKEKNEVVLYFYWNTAPSYAGCMLKKCFDNIKVISRAHRFDLYEERRKNGYIPLKRQFSNTYDKVFFLSEEGLYYYKTHYGIDTRKTSISPLGVPVPDEYSQKSTDNFFHVVSLSFCVPVKRIDKIIDAIGFFSQNNDQTKIKWTHIGDGELKNNLEDKAKKVLANKENVSFSFMGAIPNNEAKNFFLEENVDVFLNTSESEGIPVSIMEAMSAGVPSIAPDVGGVSHLVNDSNGRLMRASPSSIEVCEALESVYLSPHRDTMREKAKKKIRDEFSSNKNYKDFMNEISSL